MSFRIGDKVRIVHDLGFYFHNGEDIDNVDGLPLYTIIPNTASEPSVNRDNYTVEFDWTKAYGIDLELVERAQLAPVETALPLTMDVVREIARIDSQYKSELANYEGMKNLYDGELSRSKEKLDKLEEKRNTLAAKYNIV